LQLQPALVTSIKAIEPAATFTEYSPLLGEILEVLNEPINKPVF
jgi:hypothetical protein